VNVVPGDYEGQTCDAASAALEALGLAANCVQGNAAPDAGSEGLIYDVNPTGNVPTATIITLTIFGGQVPLDAPGAPTLPASVEPGATAQLSWGQYSCPAGTGSVSAYNFTATNGVFPSTGQSTASFGPGERTGSVQVTGAAGQPLLVSYTVTCTGGSAGERTSPASPEANAPIQAAPTPAPTGEGDDETDG
jgi:serine/threonine-protein kinase